MAHTSHPVLPPPFPSTAKCIRQYRHLKIVQLLEFVVMPDHFRGLPFVRCQMTCHLGEIVRSFKIGCTKIYRAQLNDAHIMSGEEPYMARNQTITRAQCLALNKLAADICGPGAASLNYAGLIPLE